MPKNNYINITDVPSKLYPEFEFKSNFFTNSGSSNSLSVKAYNSSGYIDFTPYSSRKLKAISHFNVALGPILLYLSRSNLY